jgi:hypothetical protein
MNYGYYSEVLAFLNDYFMRSVKDSHCLCKLNKIIESSMHENNVPIRSIHQTFIDCTEKFNDYSIRGENMRDVWRKLLDIWQ